MPWAEPTRFITVLPTCVWSVCMYTPSHAFKCWGWCFKVSRRWGKKDSVRLFCLHRTVVFGSGTGRKSHHSVPGPSAPSSCPPTQNALLESILLALWGQGSGLNYHQMASHIYRKPTKPNSQHRPQPAGVWKRSSSRLDTSSNTNSPDLLLGKP